MSEKKTYIAFDYFEALYRNTKENTVILIEPDGTIAAVNASFKECFGYGEKDIVGKSSVILFTQEDQDNGCPEKEIKKTLKTGQANDNNYLVHKNGEKIWVSGESVLVTNEEGEKMILKIVQNIHKQKTSENSVTELNKFNDNILESISDIVVVLDQELNIIKANKAYMELCHQNEDAKNNISCFLNRPGSDQQLSDILAKAVESQTAFTQKETEIETSNGNKRTFEISCTPLDGPDKKNILLVMHDITVYKELGKEREDIIGFITHELRNPLANLMLSNDLMKDAVNGNEISFLKEMLDRSENNIQRMNKMIAGLYESTKVHSGYFPLDLSTFQFGEMVEEAIETIQRLNPTYNIIVAGNGNFNIVADRNRLIQVITNFLSNAIKYSNGQKKVKLTISHDSKSATVSVKDDGLGIGQDHLPYVFERFFRLEKTRKIEGIGLGLYLCKQIIRAHKGEVGVESEEKKGSIFYFTIPLMTTDNR
ncbi:MAG: ATP-binding protein [Ginsengibacter sp.]